EPALLLPGDRFIIRKFSPVVTIGGGVVIDIGEVRYRQTDSPTARLAGMASADPASRIGLMVRESRYGMSLAELSARTGITNAAVEAEAEHAPLVIWRQPQFWLLDRDWTQQAQARLVKAVHQFHHTNPLLPGVPRQDLRGRELPGSPPFLIDALLAGARDLVAEGETIRLRSHKLVLRQDEEQARGAIEGTFEQAGLAVPAVPEVLAKSGVESGRARSLLEILIRERRLVRVTSDLVFHATALDTLRRSLGERKGTRFSVATFKEWTGV